MKRVALVLVMVALACTGAFLYQRSASHFAVAAGASPSAASSKAVSAKTATPESAASAKPASAVAHEGGETRDLRLGAFQFSVPVDWMQTNTGTRREVAFGTRDGRLGVSVQLVPATVSKAFLAAHAKHPLPEMTASLDPAQSARLTVNGLPVTVTGGTVGYAGGHRYPARFWVYRGKDAVLIINAFDGVHLYRRAVNTMAQSVRAVASSHVTAPTASHVSPFSYIERRFENLRGHI